MPGMRRPFTMLIAAALAIGLAVFRRRPVKPPVSEGTWQPVSHR